MKKVFYFVAAIIVALALNSCRSEESGVLAVRLDETAIELVKGETYQLQATVVPADEMRSLLGSLRMKHMSRLTRTVS